MALRSRQYAIMQRLKASLEADPDLAALTPAPDWKLRKLSFHMGATWTAGYYISPIVGAEPAHETQQDELQIRQLIGIVDPAHEGDLEGGMDSSLARIERVEDIFRNKGGNEAPAALRTLNAIYAGSEDAFAFQKVEVESADRFEVAALGLGYDLSACIVVVSITVPRRNVSSYGA